MWNSLTVIYVALDVIMTALVLGGAAAGVRMAWRWPRGAPAGEARDDFDRQHNLVVTLLRVGTVAGVLVTPLWFWALQSLVPAVRGGMCMASVHNLGSPGSWIASSLKAVVPALLVYWLVIDREDRRREDDRLLRHKQMLLVPLAVGSLTSATLDLHFLFTLELGPSPCCMSLFDGPGLATGADGVPGWEWTALLAALVLLQGVAVAVAQRAALARLARRATLLLAPLTVVALVLALHTRLGSALTGREQHCLFCTWQEAPASFAATCLVAVGAWWLLSRAALGSALRAAGDDSFAMRYATPYGLLLAGATVLAALLY